LKIRWSPRVARAEQHLACLVELGGKIGRTAVIGTREEAYAILGLKPGASGLKPEWRAAAATP
jgi:phage gp45-like